MAAKNETAQECVDGPYYLEKVSLPEDSDDGYEYEEVVPDEERSEAEGEEDLEAVIRAMRDAAEGPGSGSGSGSAQQAGSGSAQQAGSGSAQQGVSHIPEVVDDFLRNWLVKMDMSRTLDCFQAEWYEMGQKGLLRTAGGQVEFVPDAHTENQLLDNELRSAQRERDSYRQAAFKAGETLVKLQKERDFHRLQHKRVVQEKNKLVEDLKRLKKHYASYQPALTQLSDKYQVALRQKMLVSLERDKACGRQARGSEVDLRNSAPSASASRPAERDAGLPKSQDKPERSDPLQDDSIAPHDRRDKDPGTNAVHRHPKDSEFPAGSRVNPHLARIKALSGLGTKPSGFRLTSSLKAHPLPISCLALHPRKFIVASGGDDRVWRLWGMPAGDLVMTGEGHSDWLSGVCFHPSGGSLATAGGDATVRVWDFSLGRCVLTLEGHARAVWGCSFHSCGDFLASCSMDNTAKVWDVRSERCRGTLRGHVDSVNSVEFLPFSNTLLTSSADKTVSLWDARAGLCAQTFYGHQHSCNHAAFNPAGDTVASCDSFGVVKLWDVRKGAAMATMDTGPHPGNQVAFSPQGRTLAVASNDGSVKMVDLASSQVSSLLGHEDAVQSVVFDHKGECLLSAGSDGAILVWS